MKMPSITGGSSLPMILVLLALVFGFVFYFQVLKPSQVNEYEIAPSIHSEILELRTYKTFQLNFSLFDLPEFKSLRIFGEAPVKPAPSGKQDLFQ